MTDYWGKDQLTPFNFYDEQNASFGDYLTSPIIQHELKWPIPRKPPPPPPPAASPPAPPPPIMESFQVAGITESQIILFLLIVIVVINIATAIHVGRCLEMSTLLLASRR